MQISVIIPTRNEAKNLPSVIQHIRDTSSHAESEIVVVDGKSKDDTLSVAEKIADKALKGSEPCRGTQMHEGAEAASGDILLFLHADTRLPDKWQKVLLDTVQEKPKVVATAFKVGFDRKNFYYKFISFFANLRTRWLTGVPHGDQAIAVRKNAYIKSGGFPDVPIMEEYFLVRRLKKHGKLKILPHKVVTSTRRYEKNGPVVNNLRNLALIFLFYIGVPPHRLAKLYR